MPDYKVTADRFRQVTSKDDVTTAVRHYRGDVVTLSEEDAARLVKTGGLALVSEAEEGTSETSEEEEGPQAPEGDASVSENLPDGSPWADKPYDELQASAKERGLSAGGSKADLIARILQHGA